LAFEDKAIQDVTEQDLLPLLGRTHEIRTLDLKLALPTPSRRDRIDFLADVSSFANSAGGRLVYGIQEHPRGTAGKLVGLPASGMDAELSRLQNLIQDGLRPRLPGLQWQRVPLAPGGEVLVVEIPRSWRLPHMVSLEGHRQFYARNANGKYLVDVDELGALYRLPQTRSEWATSFRAERLAAIGGGQTPVPISRDGATLVLDLLPLEAAEYGARYDFADKERDVVTRAHTLAGGVNGHRHNFDGFVTWVSDARGTPQSFVQVFRSGAVEAVDASVARGDEEDEVKTLRVVAMERALLTHLPMYLELQRWLGVSPPIIVFLALLGVHDYEMPVREARLGEIHRFDRDDIVVPDTLIESYDETPERVLKPLLDIIWNAGGLAGSPNFDQDGRWLREHE
jgi:Putative DNA-binding domain